MGSNLSPIAFFPYKTLSHQRQDATLIEQNSKRLIHVRAYRTSTLPSKGCRCLYFTEQPRAKVFSETLSEEPEGFYRSALD